MFVPTVQHYAGLKVTITFSVITPFPDISQRCEWFAIPAICYSTFSLGEIKTHKPRKVLKQDICKSKLIIAKSHILKGQQMSWCECVE